MGVYGQDWSSYQGTYPDASGLAFVFIKVTEGMSYTNPYWQSQRGDAISAGAAVGFYHYPHMHNNAQNEADYFAVHAQIQPNQMIVLDWEGYDSNNADLSNQEKLDYKETYLAYMKQKFPNNPVGLYCNTDYWFNVDTTSHAGDFLWIATAGRNAGDPGIQAAWKFHQYSDNPVDKDYGNFNSGDDLKAWIASFNPTTPPPVEDDLPYTEAQLTTIVQNAVMSQAVRDELAFANIYWLDAVFSGKPLVSTNAQIQNVVNILQTELTNVMSKLDPALVTELQAAVQKAIASTAITATVNVNGKVV